MFAGQKKCLTCNCLLILIQNFYELRHCIFPFLTKCNNNVALIFRFTTGTIGHAHSACGMASIISSDYNLSNS